MDQLLCEIDSEQLLVATAWMACFLLVFLGLKDIGIGD